MAEGTLPWQLILGRFAITLLISVSHVAIILNLRNKRVVLMSVIFYCNRIVDAWNSLSDTVVSAPSINSSKRKLCEVNLDRHLTIVE